MQNAAAAGLVVLYFIWFAGRWVTAGFTPDDLMNGQRALEQPLWKLLLDHVTVFLPTVEYRPFGNLLYRVLYRAFGFQPLPFHVALYAFLAANLYLTYWFVRRLTGTASAGWAATVFHAWHGNWTTLHLSFGYCYDVLCYFFYVAALIAFDAGRFGLFLVLFILGLDSKEMAVSLPVVCFVWKGRENARAASAAIAAGIVTAAFVGGRLMVRDGLIVNQAYVPQFDLSTLFDRLGAFLQLAAYGDGREVPAGLLLAAAAAWGLARCARVSVVALTILFVGILPVAFIPQRGLESVYVPYLGVAILFATPLAALVKQPLAATVAAILLAGTFHHLRRDRHPEGHFAEAAHIMSVTRQLRAAAPYLPKGAHVLFERDPFPQFDWNSYFLVRLVYDDPTVEVDRPGRSRYGPNYDVVFDWDAAEGQGFLRRSKLEATSVRTTPNRNPSK
jgi:hypothetical protein